MRYDVQITETLAPWGFARHMRVMKVSGKSGISWDALQKLKNEYLGPDVLAIEIFPPEHSLVNEINARHLWEVPEHIPLPSLRR